LSFLILGQVQDLAAARLAEVEHAARGYLGDVAALERVAYEQLPESREVMILWAMIALMTQRLAKEGA
jgi:hypothetical protein